MSWTLEEESALSFLIQTMSAEQIAPILGKSPRSVAQKARYMWGIAPKAPEPKKAVEPEDKTLRHKDGRVVNYG